MVERSAPELRALVPDLLARPGALTVPDGEVARRAAVTLVLSPGENTDGPAQALLVQRAEVARDPWSGHVALPGGRADPGDTDLVHTARRELEEETGLLIPRECYLGRLNDQHPRSRHLPSIAVTPFVAWLDQRTPVRPNEEVADHRWVALPDLAAPYLRSRFLRPEPEPRWFETIEVSGLTVWGMTLAIIDNFLERLAGGAG